MSVEVDSHAYRFYPAPDEWKADPIPGLLEDVILGTAMPEGVEEPSPPTQVSEPPFQHYPLNDWESLWWVSMYMVVDRVVTDKSGLSGEAVSQQITIARTLFYDYKSRLSFFTDWRTGLAVPSPQVARMVQVLVKPFTGFRNALMADKWINLNDQNVLIDFEPAAMSGIASVSTTAKPISVALPPAVAGGCQR